MPAQPPASSAAIVPFWNRLRGVMLYPAHAGSLAAIVLFALARLLIFVPLGWIFALLSMVAMYRYAFECLRASADGYLEPPGAGLSGDRSLGWKYIWLILILGVVAIIGLVKLGPVVGLILVLFIGLSLPGATMTLAMEESLASALNPLQWITIFMRVGWPYLAVAALCLVITLSEGYATQFVKNLMPPFVAVGLIGIISNYALVMTFHLMGYLLYQYHEELGLAPEAPQLVRSATMSHPDQTLLDDAAALVRDGKPDEATDLVRKQVRRGALPAVHVQFRKLLRLGDNKAELLDHGRDYLMILLGQGNDQSTQERLANDRLIMDLLRECQALDPAFAPATAGQVAQLAFKAEQLGQQQAALLLLSGFQGRFPKSQYVAQCGLLEATLLHEYKNQDEEALVFLRNLKTTVPGDPLMPEIDAKISMIERMMAATRKPERPQS